MLEGVARGHVGKVRAAREIDEAIIARGCG